MWWTGWVCGTSARETVGFQVSFWLCPCAWKHYAKEMNIDRARANLQDTYAGTGRPGRESQLFRCWVQRSWCGQEAMMRGCGRQGLEAGAVQLLMVFMQLLWNSSLESNSWHSSHLDGGSQTVSQVEYLEDLWKMPKLNLKFPDWGLCHQSWPGDWLCHVTKLRTLLGDVELLCLLSISFLLNRILNNSIELISFWGKKSHDAVRCLLAISHFCSL